MAKAEVDGLLRPIDRQVDLADLLERFRGVLQPGGDLPVLGVRADDRVDVVIQDCEPLRVPVEGEPFARVTGGPPIVRGGAQPKSGLDLYQPLPVCRHPYVAERRRIRDRVELEVVDLVIVELELHHPVDQLPDRRLGGSGSLRVELQQPTAGIPDDPAGVVGLGDHLQRRRERLVRDRVDLGRGGRRNRGHEDVDGLVHVPAVRVGGAVAVEVRAGTDQREYGVGQRSHLLILHRPSFGPYSRFLDTGVRPDVYGRKVRLEQERIDWAWVNDRLQP